MRRAIAVVFALVLGGLVLATLSLPVINQPGESRNPGVPRTVCSQCQGACRVKCAACAGFGTVESDERLPCPYCGGTGIHKKKLSEGFSSCPFCNGQGVTREHARKTCAMCGGYGYTACPTCSGSGYIAAAPPPPSTLERIAHAVNGWIDSVSGRATRLSQIKSD